jgi:tetratricopeptide (TPR) repeat protein
LGCSFPHGTQPIEPRPVAEHRAAADSRPPCGRPLAAELEAVRPLLEQKAFDPVEVKRAGNRAYAERRYEVARDAFRSLIAAQPQEPAGYVGLAKANEVLHRQEETVSCLAPVALSLRHWGVLRAISNASRVLVFQGHLGVLELAIDFHRAAIALRQDSVLWFYLGELLRHSGEQEEAADAYRASLALDPSSPSVRAALKSCGG